MLRNKKIMFLAVCALILMSFIVACNNSDSKDKDSFQNKSSTEGNIIVTSINDAKSSSENISDDKIWMLSTQNNIEWEAEEGKGKVLALDSGNRIILPECETAWDDDFSIFFWIKVEQSKGFNKLIFEHGVISIKINSSGDLSLISESLDGDTTLSYIPINDGSWHHIAMVYNGYYLYYYFDGIACKQSKVSLELNESNSGVYPIVFAGDVPAKIFDFRIDKSNTLSVNEAMGEKVKIIVPEGNPSWKCRHGIALDRRQYMPDKNAPNYIPVLPYASEMKIYSDDIAAIADMGFEHAKVLFTPSFYINQDDGTLTNDGKTYIEEVVTRVLDQGIGVLICIHPEADFKKYYLGSWEHFETLLSFYENLSRFISSHSKWTPDKVAFQLMTEPFDNIGDWGTMHYRMWAAARRGAPLHTIILSADINSSDGNHVYAVERLKPVPDANVYYSFTTYEPYEIGFNYLKGGVWQYIGPIPYPMSTDNLDEQISNLTKNVPDNLRSNAEEALREYANAGYDAEWFLKRAEHIDKWSRSFGGKLSLFCSEFGSLDHVVWQPRTGMADPEGRYRMIHDLRESFDKYNIGWSYWSYNEVFTVLDPEKRVPFADANSDLIKNWYDYKMLESLGRVK